MAKRQVNPYLEGAKAAALAAVAAPYTDLAQHIAKALEDVKTAADGVAEERGTVWSMFRNALKLANEAKHSPEAMREGLEAACNKASIPAGSFRSYIATVESVAVKVKDGAVTLENALKLSIGDARKLVKPATTEAQQRKRWALEALHKAIEGWTADQIADLAQTIFAGGTAETEQRKAA